MKNFKLNKLAENRLNEKEMRDLTGGLGVKYEINIVCSADPNGPCCVAWCTCIETFGFCPTSYNGISGATSNQSGPLVV